MGNIIVAAILIAAVGIVIWTMRKDKKAGKRSCGCGCENCAARCSDPKGREERLL